MLLARLTQYHITPSNLLLFEAAPALDPATACCDNQPLAERMGMPCRASAGFERHQPRTDARRIGCLKQRIDSHMPVKYSAGPLAEGCEPLCLISIVSTPLAAQSKGSRWVVVLGRTRVVPHPNVLRRLYRLGSAPYLDGIQWTIIPNRSTQTLAFIAGKFDMTFPYEVTLQSMRDIHNQAPNAICEMTPTPVAMNLLVNRGAAPFNDPDIRRAMQLTIDRKSFLDIIAEGQGDINGAMQSPPVGLWGLPPENLATP